MKKEQAFCRSSQKKVFIFLVVCLGLFLNFQVLNAQNQKINISGVIKGTTGESIIGASIIEIGKTNGTVTDIDGNFTLSVASDAKLSISYLGYKTQEITVEGKTTFNVVLIEDSEVLDEVVVVGYGTMRKKDLTGSITQIRPDKLANENPGTVQDILRGTPGLNVGFDSSAKGGGSMQIRGQRSVYSTDNYKSHNDPLIILDGMIFYGELSEINPDDIGQIDILKDASAAAVYGAKSANGVIIITTKKGKIGKPTVNFNSSVGFTTMGANRKVFDANGYLQYRKDWYTAGTYGVNSETGKYEAYANGSQIGKFENPNNLAKYGVTLDQWRGYTNNGDMSDNEIWATRLNMEGRNIENFLEGKTFDWYDHSFRTGINQDYNVSISGASDRMNYYMSIGYLSNEGVAEGNDYSAIRSNLKLEGQVTDWLSISANVNFQDRTDGDIAVDWGKQITANSPFSSPWDADGNLLAHPMGETDSKGWNYLFDRQYKKLEKGYTVLNTIFSAKIKLPYNVSYTFNASPRYQYFYDRYFESSEHPDWSALDHGVNREQAKRFDWSINNTINWDYTFNKKHHVNLTLVQEAEERKYWMDKIQARNLQPTDALGFHETSVGDKERSSFDSHDDHETAVGYLGRLFYSYDDRYMLTTSVRRDGYSAFGTSNPYATFFSVALGWSFANENFFKWEPMSMGKLRLSWGQNGNRSLENPYVALADLGAGVGATYGYYDASGAYVQYRYMSMGRLANPHLQWEKTASWNVGLDFGFLNNKITGTVDFYRMPTTDMIMNQKLPLFSGFGSITCNLGEVINQGVELSVTSHNISNDVLEWTTTFGFSKYKNEIKHLYYSYENVLDANGNVIEVKESNDVANGWFIGQPISTIWNYRVTGIWQTDEVEEAARYGQRPGDPKVANNFTEDDIVNADGSITPVYNDKDKEFLGQTAPPIHWSLRNDFTILKNIQFSFNIYSYWGHKSVETMYLNQDNGSSGITRGENVYAKQYWTPENPTNKYARLDAKGPTGVNSPARLYDRSFIRLENISMAYILPQKITTKWSIERVKVFGSVRNVAVWAKDWNYWDPETGGLAPRTYTIGLNLTF